MMPKKLPDGSDSHTNALDQTTDNRPPRPRLTVRVGVTGHRLNALPSEGEDQQLRDAVRRILEEIKRITMEIFSRRTESDIETYSSEEPCLRLISPLAEGADRLVTEEALKLGLELHCPLPFPREEYVRDFAAETSCAKFWELLSKATSVFELDGTRDANQEAYEMVGRTVLRQSDVLIAIWDQGRPTLLEAIPKPRFTL
jgi:hypothetical protein